MKIVVILFFDVQLSSNKEFFAILMSLNFLKCFKDKKKFQQNIANKKSYEQN